MLHPGLYEQVINSALNSELSTLPEARKAIAPIDKAEASKVLAQYLADVVQKALDNVIDNGGDISAQIALTNQIVDLIQTTTKEADFASMSVAQRAEQLLALLRENDPRLLLGKTAADMERPETSVAHSSLFTGAIHEPQMFSELKKEINSADQIDMLVSFIKWSGLRLIIDELREFSQNGGQLRDIRLRQLTALHHGAHHQPQAAAVHLVEKAFGLGPGGVLPVQNGEVLLGPHAPLMPDGALGLQSGEHGDDGVFRPAGLLPQGGKARQIGHLAHPVQRVARLLAAHHGGLVLRTGVAHGQAHYEPVQLGVGQQLGARGPRRILGGDD